MRPSKAGTAFYIKRSDVASNFYAHCRADALMQRKRRHKEIGMSPDPVVISGLGELTPEEQVRAARANEIFQGVWGGCGVRVSSWMDFAAWRSYLKGDIEDRELGKQAKEELEDLARTFGKYVIIKEEEPESLRDYPVERKRAALANKIYRKICHDLGLTLCFFSDFSSWSDYVKGKIGEAEFHERAKAEAERMLEKAKAV
jgi:hypothetical protein